MTAEKGFWRHWLSGRSKRQLSAVEAAVVEAVLGCVPEPVAMPLRDELLGLRRVHRMSAGRSVELYYNRSGGSLPPPCGNSERFTSAHISLDAPGIPGQLEADLWLVNGRIFEIIFSQPMSRIGGLVSALTQASPPRWPPQGEGRPTIRRLRRQRRHKIQARRAPTANARKRSNK